MSYFARKGELLFTNSDQIEADRLCELSKKEKKSVHYMHIKEKKNSAKDRLGIHCPVSCMMLKVVNLHQKPRKNRSQRNLELKYQGKYPQNRTKNHSTNPMPFKIFSCPTDRKIVQEWPCVTS